MWIAEDAQWPSEALSCHRSATPLVISALVADCLREAMSVAHRPLASCVQWGRSGRRDLGCCFIVWGSIELRDVIVVQAGCGRDAPALLWGQLGELDVSPCISMSLGLSKPPCLSVSPCDT